MIASDFFHFFMLPCEYKEMRAMERNETPLSINDITSDILRQVPGGQKSQKKR